MIVDRLEGTKAVVETEAGVFIRVPLSRLPPGVREGDALTLREGRYSIDTLETKRRGERVKSLFERLRRR